MDQTTQVNARSCGALSLENLASGAMASTRPGKRYKKRWKDPLLLMGKSTINHHFPFPWPLSESAIAETPRKPGRLTHLHTAAISSRHCTIATSCRQPQQLAPIPLCRSLELRRNPCLHNVSPLGWPREPDASSVEDQHFRSGPCKSNLNIVLPFPPELFQ